MNNVQIARRGRCESIMVTMNLGGVTEFLIHCGVILDIKHTKIIIEMLPVQINS